MSTSKYQFLPEKSYLNLYPHCSISKLPYVETPKLGSKIVLRLILPCVIQLFNIGHKVSSSFSIFNCILRGLPNCQHFWPLNWLKCPIPVSSKWIFTKISHVKFQNFASRKDAKVVRAKREDSFYRVTQGLPLVLSIGCRLNPKP